ncbi:MAG: bactofilin family protein [Burkholderiales bacterium]
MPQSFLLSRAAAFCLTILGLVAGVGHAAEDADTQAGNVYMAGAEVHVDRAINRDLVAAAGRIQVDQPIAGDAVFGAGALDVHATIGEGLRAAGGVITLNGRVHGDVLLVGGHIEVGPMAEVHGEAWIAGSRVTVSGRSLSGLKLYAREITIAGEIHGPLELSGRDIQVLATARIYGDLVYSSSQEIRIDPAAVVSGQVTRATNTTSISNPLAEIPILKALRPLLLTGLLVTGLLLCALFPRFTEHASALMRHSPVRTLGLGTALFFSVPPVAVLLIITIIGIPIGIALGAFHAVALLAAYLVSCYFVGDALARVVRHVPHSRGARMGLLAIGLLVLTFVTTVPYVGPLVLLLALIAGLGAIVLQAFSRYTTAAAADSAPTALPW